MTLKFIYLSPNAEGKNVYVARTGHTYHNWATMCKRTFSTLLKTEIPQSQMQI
jgi:hypothetical protein